jgi:hypothetical protein
MEPFEHTHLFCSMNISLFLQSGSHIPNGEIKLKDKQSKRNYLKFYHSTHEEDRKSIVLNWKRATFLRPGCFLGPPDPTRL